jgi:predicted nucleic acid-binding protein
MSSSSFLISSSTVLVADASVVINLNATDRALDIIRAQPGSIIVTENAFAELARGTRNGHHDAEKLQVLIDCGAVHLVQLGNVANDIYGSLIEGAALRTLDDGEAATIGYACEIGGIALIDERKARSICASDFPELAVASTVDLLTHETVRNALGHQGHIDVIIKALRNARMRVPPHQVGMVVEIIGEETAATCNSLSKAMRAAK